MPSNISHNAYRAFLRGKSRAARHGRAGKCPRREYVSAEQFRDARAFSGLSREAAASFLKVSLRTIGNWETGQARPSYAAFKLLRVYRHGDLIHPAWSACHINHRGALVTPEGHEIQPRELGWLSLLVRRAALLSEVVRERDHLRGQLAAAAARPSSVSVFDPAKRGSKTVEIIAPQVSWSYVGDADGFISAFPARSPGGLPSSNRGVSETERTHGDSVRSVRAVVGGAR